MSKGVLVFLGTILLGAVASIVFLLADGPMGDASPWIGRGDPEAAEQAALLDAGAASLAASRNAKRPKTPEEIAAEQAAAAAPTFARSEGVFGTVTNGRGEPVADAVVKLMEGKAPSRNYRYYGGYGRAGQPDAAPLAEATTNEKGEFLVGPAPQDAFLRIRADAEGYAATVRDLKRRGYCVDLVLDVGGKLIVETKDAEGGAIADTRIFHTAGVVMTEATTDADGRAELTNLPTGDGSILASSAGHAAVTQSGVGVSPERTETVTLVLGDPLIVEGTVTGADGIAPIEGVKLRLEYSNMPWLAPAEPAESDEAGAFEIEACAGRGQWISLEATAEEFAPFRTWVQLQDSGNGRMKVEVKLAEERAPILGRVMDADGHAAGGARVTFVPRGVPGEEPPEVVAEADGSFELPAPPWPLNPGQSIHVLASAPGKGVGSARTRIAKVDDVAQPAVVELCGVGRVEGTVVDGGSNPLPGALVTLLLDWQEMRNMNGGRHNSSLYSAINSSKVTRLDAVTDIEGNYAIEDVPCAAFRVQAEYGLDRITQEEPLRISHGDTATRRVEFVDGGTIEGYVYDSEDRPVAGASIRGGPARGSVRGGWSPGGYVTARSQNDGRFVLHGASLAAYDLSAYAAGFESNAEKNVASGTKDVTLRLRAQGWVTGVVEMNGMGYRGTFTVRAVRVNANNRNRNRNNIVAPGFSGWQPGSKQNTFSPDDGRFELRGLSAGDYDLTVTSPEGHIGAEAVRIAVVDGTGSTARLSLVSGASVSGTLLNDETGLPIAKARITIQGKPQSGQVLPAASSQTDAEGRFTVRGLGTGSYVAHVWPPNGTAFQEPLELAAGESRVIELRQQAPGSIQISVVTLDGAPVVGVRPMVSNASGNMIWPNWSAFQKEGVKFGPSTWQSLMQTDEQGVNVRRHLPPGDYTVKAVHGGHAPAVPVAVTVRSGRTARVELVLERAASGTNPGN